MDNFDIFFETAKKNLNLDQHKHLKKKLKESYGLMRDSYQGRLKYLQNLSKSFLTGNHGEIAKHHATYAQESLNRYQDMITLHRDFIEHTPTLVEESIKAHQNNHKKIMKKLEKKIKELQSDAAPKSPWAKLAGTLAYGALLGAGSLFASSPKLKASVAVERFIDHKALLPIPLDVPRGTEESQRRFDACLDELNRAFPSRKKEVFETVEEAQPYIDNYVLPRLYYISDQGWISEDPKLVGYYRKNWKDSNDLIERISGSSSWSVDLICNPYEMIRQKISLSAAKLVFGESVNRPIPQEVYKEHPEPQIIVNAPLPIPLDVPRGTEESQRRFDACLDELNRAFPARKKEVFETVEEAQPYIDNYVLPRLYYISDQGWISEDPKLVGYYRKNWKDSNDLIERIHSSPSWSVDLICNPYEMIRQKISLSAAKLVFGETSAPYIDYDLLQQDFNQLSEYYSEAFFGQSSLKSLIKDAAQKKYEIDYKAFQELTMMNYDVDAIMETLSDEKLKDDYQYQIYLDQYGEKTSLTLIRNKIKENLNKLKNRMLEIFGNGASIFPKNFNSSLESIERRLYDSILADLNDEIFQTENRLSHWGMIILSPNTLPALNSINPTWELIKLESDLIKYLSINLPNDFNDYFLNYYAHFIKRLYTQYMENIKEGNLDSFENIMNIISMQYNQELQAGTLDENGYNVISNILALYNQNMNEEIVNKIIETAGSILDLTAEHPVSVNHKNKVIDQLYNKYTLEKKLEILNERRKECKIVLRLIEANALLKGPLERFDNLNFRGSVSPDFEDQMASLREELVSWKENELRKAYSQEEKIERNIKVLAVPRPEVTVTDEEVQQMKEFSQQLRNREDYKEPDYPPLDDDENILPPRGLDALTHSTLYGHSERKQEFLLRLDELEEFLLEEDNTFRNNINRNKQDITFFINSYNTSDDERLTATMIMDWIIKIEQKLLSQSFILKHDKLLLIKIEESVKNLNSLKIQRLIDRIKNPDRQIF